MARITLSLPRLGRLAALLVLSLAASLPLLATGQAQETPEASPQPTPGATGTPAETGTVVSIEILAEEVPVKEGEILQARILVEDVEHLAGFSFFLTYDDDKLRPVGLDSSSDGTPPDTGAQPPPVDSEGDPVEVSALGEFLLDSDRGPSMSCGTPTAEGGRVGVVCSTFEAPVCLGGPAGASGSGVLAVIPLESRGGGLTTLNLVQSTLVRDDWDPCDPVNSTAEPILHTTRGASIELVSLDGTPIWLIVLIVVVVLAVLGGGGWFGYRWYRQRQAGVSA